MKGKTVLFSIMAILVSISLLITSACSSKTTSTTTTATTTTTSSSPQILRLNLAAEPDSIDPNQASWADDKSVISQCFEGLLSFNADGSLKADVATVIPTVANGGISADGLTITFKLKNNVTWSDGTKVTANDFVYSIKRELDPTLACEYASFYFDIVGSEAYYSCHQRYR